MGQQPTVLSYQSLGRAPWCSPEAMTCGRRWWACGPWLGQLVNRGQARVVFRGTEGVNWCIFPAIEVVKSMRVLRAAACVARWHSLVPKTHSLRNNKAPVGHPPFSLRQLQQRTQKKKKKREKHLRDQMRPHPSPPTLCSGGENLILHLPPPGAPALRSELAWPRRGACVCV